jgi:hydrogenase nickel incorporation protein HypA/HybF
MHEHALIADLVRAVLKAAESENARAVLGISVWLGALSHMTPAHFAEHFADAAAGTIAAGAAIDATVSDDIYDPRAASVLLTGVEVEGSP